MGGGRRLIALLGAICVTGGTWTVRAADTTAAKPAVASAQKPGSPAKPKGNPLAPAIAELQKEYQAYIKDPKANKLRDKSDYFGKTNPADTDVTPEVILKALEQSVSGGPGAEAYVKWQLLSALPGKFGDDLYKRAVAVYRRAPSPLPHPGANHKQVLRDVRGMKKDQVGEIQREFDQAVEQSREQNKVLLHYRDELYARLPYKLEALSAGLEDTAERASRGLNATGIFDNVAAGVRSWAISEAKAGQVQSMIGAVQRLKDLVTGDEAKPYNKVYEDKGAMKWKAEGGGVLDPKKPEELMRFLENNASGGAAGGLKFKDGK